ncbi:MAG TPA: hypothetical protein VHW44_17135 [Pseudonocardiaceae bacterium]|jgi:hypothetical protein|nr:hypothetical protein [Pseudonocardiaceae bacterium]
MCRRRRARRTRSSLSLAAVALLATLTGCASTISGSAEPAPGDATTTAPAAPTACAPTDLTTCLMAVPTGAQQWAQPYAPDGPLTMQQFLDRIYFDQNATQKQSVTQQLQAQGLRTIAHQSWHATNSDDSDLLLFDFGAAAGATSRTSQQVSAYTGDPQYKRVSMPDLAAAKVSVFRLATVDDQDQVAVIALAAFGPVAMQFFFWSNATLDSATLESYLKQEIAILGPLH